MANFTENYDLILPEQDDYYDVDEFNENMEVLDSAVAELSEEVDGLGEKLDELNEKLTALDNKIGTQSDSGTNTVYGLLKSGTQLFKSWKRYTYVNANNTVTSATIDISTVDPTRCIVLVERLRNGNNHLSGYNYSLEATQINLDHDSTTAGYLQLAFTVLELY